MGVAKKQSFSSETSKSGKQNKTGKNLEGFTENALISAGYTEFWDHKASAFENRKSIGGKQYAKQLPVGKTVYESTRQCDFFVVNHAKFKNDLIIECRWQQVGGSVDEKLPYLYFNILKTSVPTIVLIDGGGCRATALKWLKDQVNPKSALIAVFTMVEFQTAINDGLLE